MFGAVRDVEEAAIVELIEAPATIVPVTVAFKTYVLDWPAPIDWSDDAAEDEAVMVSTTYHTMYNMIVVALLLFVALAAV